MKDGKEDMKYKNLPELLAEILGLDGREVRRLLMKEPETRKLIIMSAEESLSVECLKSLALVFMGTILSTPGSDLEKALLNIQNHAEQELKNHYSKN